LKVEKLGNVQRPETQNAGTPQTGQAPTVKNAARLQEIILVTVSDLLSLVRYSKCLSDQDQPVVPCAPQAIGLFLDGRHIKGIVPESGAPTLVDSPGAPEPVDGRLQFHLQRNADSDEAWADLLGAPPLGKSFFERPTEVSVGPENGYALPTDVKANAPDKQRQFWLIRIDLVWFIICSILLFFVLVLLIVLAKHSELLRDLGPTQVFENWPGLLVWWRERHQRKHKPYSLARFQMAFWFFLIVASFLFIWLITGANDTITGSTLALIGIGAGTALGSAAIDAAGDGNAPAQPQVSRGFFTDILTDHRSGISFHRFQMFIWTLVLGVLFIYSVWGRLSMPEFSATLLAMLGISSGTYLGFKIPEQQQSEATGDAAGGGGAGGGAGAGGAPTITSLSPSSVTAGTVNQAVQIIGTGFVDGDTVHVNDTPQPTTFVSATEHTAEIDDALLATPATLKFKVVNQAGASSTETDFTVT
jgi:hypothetical protein